MMEKQKNIILIKPRSYQGVIVAGFRLYAENFRRLFKGSWLLAAFYSVCSAVAGTLAVIKIPEVTLMLLQQMQLPAEAADASDSAMSAYLVVLLAIIASTVVSLTAMLAAMGTVVGLLKEHVASGLIPVPTSWFSVQWSIVWRTLKGALATAACMLLPWLLLCGILLAVEHFSDEPMSSHVATLSAALAVITLAVAVMSLPLGYQLMKYLTTDNVKYWPSIGEGYVRGLRHLGQLLAVALLSGLMTCLAMMVIALPGYILSLANMSAQAGLLIGDPLDMPSYMSVLTFVTFVLTSFMTFYVTLPMLLHAYYSFGSIEAKELECQQKPDMQ